MRSDYDVVIVGAGMAGATLALSLVDSGLRIAIVEAQPSATTIPVREPDVSAFDPRVSALTPASATYFASLGLWDEIAGNDICAYRHMCVWDGQGSGEISFDSSEAGVSELGFIVENRLITTALLNRLRSSGGLDWRCPAKLEEIVVPDAAGDDLLGPVSLKLDSGEKLTGALLVAADGALSAIRARVGFRTREWDYGHHALVCTVETGESHRFTAWQNFTAHGPLALLPLPEIGGRHFCSLVWSSDPRHNDELRQIDDDEFCGRITRFSEGRLGSVLATSSRFSFPLRQRHAVDYVCPGVALVGDAAHTIHPLAGQGINLGLQDVAVLSEELLRATHGPYSCGDLRVLNRYQRRRKADNLLMMAAMDGFKRLFSTPALPLRVLRSTGMSLLDTAPLVKERVMKHAMGLN